MSSTRRATALKYLDAASTFDLDAIMALRSPDCTHEFHPPSVGVRPPLDNTAYEAQLRQFKDIVVGFPVTIKEIIEDDKENRLMVLLESSQTWSSDAKDAGLSEEEWAFSREYVFVLTMDETGEKITRVVEFLDSKGTEQLRVLVARATGNMMKQRGQA